MLALLQIFFRMIKCCPYYSPSEEIIRMAAKTSVSLQVVLQWVEVLNKRGFATSFVASSYIRLVRSHLLRSQKKLAYKEEIGTILFIISGLLSDHCFVVVNNKHASTHKIF